MAKITVNNLFCKDLEGYVVFCTKDELSDSLKMIHKQFDMDLAAIAKKRDFEGYPGDYLTVLADKANHSYIILVGIGSATEDPNELLENFRRAVGLMVRECELHKISKLGIFYPENILSIIEADKIAQEYVATQEIASYHFDDFITDSSCKIKRDFDTTIFAPLDLHSRIESGIAKGQIIGNAVNKARYWTDLPSNKVKPETIADYAQEIAQQNGLKITIFDEKAVTSMAMGGICAVSSGSQEESRLVIMEYFAQDNVPTIALVGKGVTFDAGGLNLKHRDAMCMMKVDMAGAAAVLAAIEAIALLKPNINVIAIAPLVENLPGSKAMKPGDIIKFYNGKTAEIQDTDAEGRLILADALSYVTQHYKLDAVISIATLTYSCIEGLGHFFAALMSKDTQMADKLLTASWRSGDRAWRLPFHDDYRKGIRSNVADIANLGDERAYKADVITAAFFLKNFTGNVPFLHLDIAGTAFDVPGISYYRHGATGFGVRLFIEFLTDYK